MAIPAMVYTAEDVGSLTLEMIRQRMAGKEEAVLSGIETLDRFLMPFWPGELIVIMARTGHYKTSFLTFLARRIAQQIKQQAMEHQQELKEMVIFAEWEMYVEQLGLYDVSQMTQIAAKDLWLGKVAKKDWPRVEVAASDRGGLPVWIAGPSMVRRREQVSLTLPEVQEALRRVEEEIDWRARAIMLDHLQEIDPVAGERDRRLQVVDNMRRAKRLARDCGCPVFLGVQAGRKVDDRECKLPQVGDGEESSRIEQAADKLISLSIPCKT
jgi:replicative DNA helicase